MIVPIIRKLLTYCFDNRDDNGDPDHIRPRRPAQLRRRDRAWRFRQAADRLGRSTSAVSAQLKKLEGQAGAPILRKSGRGLALTPTGETLLAYARRLIELNDEAVAAARGVELEGWVRIGLQEDFGETLLPEALGRFARAHPKVRSRRGSNATPR